MTTARTRTVTTDGNAVITSQGRLITTPWRPLSSGPGGCRVYRGFTWVIIPNDSRYMAQLSGQGRPAVRRFFNSAQEAVRWLERESLRQPISQTAK